MMHRDLRRRESPSLYCIEPRTQNWEQMVRWYREVLGLRVLVRVMEDGYALVEAGDTRIALIVSSRRGRGLAADQPGLRGDRRPQGLCPAGGGRLGHFAPEARCRGPP